MTIAALLRHHGVNVPRYVTVDGQIVFDDVMPTHNGYAHPELGTVTPVARHTFHRGEEEPDDAPASPADRAWWDAEEKLGRHIDAMKRSFPSFIYLPPEEGQRPCWGGVIDTGRGSFKVGIFPRRDEGLPSVAVFGPKLGVNAGRRWVPSPHLYVGGNLCVADQDDWKPDEHTVATVTAWAAHWLAAYTEWRMTRRWPMDGAHGLSA